MDDPMTSMLGELMLRKLASPTLSELKISKKFDADLKKLQSDLILLQENADRRYQANVLGYVELNYKIDELLDGLNIYAARQHQHMDKVPFLTLTSMKNNLLHKLRILLVFESYDLSYRYLYEEDGVVCTFPFYSSFYVRKMHSDLENLVGKLLLSGSENPLIIPSDEYWNNSRLVKDAYNRVHLHFDIKFWIEVDGILDERKTMLCMLKCLNEGHSTRSEPLPSELHALQSLLREYLVGKRYLLVLDRVANIEQAVSYIDMLSNGIFGSKIVITGHWSHVRDYMSTRTRIPRLDDPLYLIFKDLPPMERLCLGYCSLLPLNYKINREKLIHQWVAFGFVASVSDKYMEEKGEEYFDSLFSKFSFFCDVSADDDGNFQEFTIHESSALIKSFFGRDYESWFMDPPRACHLNFEKDISSRRMHSLFTLFKRLRVLNLSGCGISRLLESIGNLISLRYLDLSDTPIQKLPKGICNLVNLQTLYLSNCKHLKELPCEMSNLINLRHLDIKGCEILSRMPGNMGKLEKLQTLSTFIIGEELEESLIQLKHLDLRGELEIKQLAKVGYFLPEACLEYKLLHSLALFWSYDKEAKMDTKLTNSHCNAESVLSCLVPPRSLKSLSINGYPGSVMPQWLDRTMLPDLTKLVLLNCKRCETLPPLGSFLSLNVLQLQGMDGVVKIGTEFFGKENGTKFFPVLREFILQDFPALRSWESRELVEAFPCLRKLSIIDCPMLTSIPCFPSLQHLDLHNCSNLVLKPAEELKPFSNLASTLQNLEIRSCPELQGFPDWIENLTSLQSLSILHCQNLKSVSEGLKHLRELQSLSVTDCPNLERRCRKDTGEDWHKILHVPNVYIGSSLSHGMPNGATTSSS